MKTMKEIRKQISLKIEQIDSLKLDTQDFDNEVIYKLLELSAQNLELALSEVEKLIRLGAE